MSIWKLAGGLDLTAYAPERQTSKSPGKSVAFRPKSRYRSQTRKHLTAPLISPQSSKNWFLLLAEDEQAVKADSAFRAPSLAAAISEGVQVVDCSSKVISGQICAQLLPVPAKYPQNSPIDHSTTARTEIGNERMNCFRYRFLGTTPTMVRGRNKKGKRGEPAI